jgi:hypothetical protein
MYLGTNFAIYQQAGSLHITGSILNVFFFSSVELCYAVKSFSPKDPMDLNEEKEEENNNNSGEFDLVKAMQEGWQNNNQTPLQQVGGIPMEF